MDLLERETQLEALAGALAEAAGGAGRVVLVHGEAGIGKTSLVECFAAEHANAARVLWGTCDALFTPRPLGPLYDIAQQTPGHLLALLNNAETNRAALFSAVLGELQAGATLVVIEDAHWADEATLDLIKFLGRRIHRLKALLIVTFRDDELKSEHPLWFALGDLPDQTVRRVRLSPLSERAVRALAAQKGRPAGGLYELTDGNPFFLKAVLANDAGQVPATVREAVLARAARLSPEARQVLDLISVVPLRIERWLLEALLAPAPAVLEASLRTSLVGAQSDSFAFRHELARQAIENELPPAQARDWHGRVLQALLARGRELEGGEQPVPLARLVHHARLAGDRTAVLEFAPRAARQAAALGAHREAATHYQTALEYTDQLAPEARAELLENLSFERYLTGQVAEAVAPRQEAIAIWERLGRRVRQGDCLRSLSRIVWYMGQNELAYRYAVEAVRVLEVQPPGPELAMAYSNLCGLHMIGEETEAAIAWGTRAIELAERAGATEALISALGNVGTSQLLTGDEAGRAKLEHSLRLALEHDMQDQAAGAYANLGSCALDSHDYNRAMEYLREGMAYATEHDLFTRNLCMLNLQSLIRFRQGRWDEAQEAASAILTSGDTAVLQRLEAITMLGYLRVRRGDPGWAELLDEARQLAQATRELQSIGPVAAARAEAAWLQGDPQRAQIEVKPAFEWALRLAGDRWRLGELALWMWRAGALPQAPDGLPEPYAREIAGDWRAAADAWQTTGDPYEQALALSEGDEAAQRQALAIFQQLGAAPAADRVRQKMRAKGVRRLPRGPRLTTREHPLGLTARETEILALLGQRRTNAEIAAQLRISPKTVDHHVSAVLAKLDVHTREAAAQVAASSGLPTPK